jgi:hypothetical protein
MKSVRNIALVTVLVSVGSAQAWWGSPFDGFGDGYADGGFSFRMGGGTRAYGDGYGYPYYGGYPYGEAPQAYGYPYAPAVDQETLEKQAKAQQEAIQAQREAMAKAIEAQHKAAAEYVKQMPAVEYVNPLDPVAMTRYMEAQGEAIEAFMDQQMQAREAQAGSRKEEYEAYRKAREAQREQRRKAFEQRRAAYTTPVALTTAAPAEEK